METVHATAVMVHGRGVLIRGVPGAGKSSLALALIEDSRGDCALIADDRVELTQEDDRVIASAPAALRGLLEVRGVGIINRPFRVQGAVELVVDLLPPDQCPRMPEDADRSVILRGGPLPRLALPIGAVDAALRVRVAVAEWLG